MRILKFSTLLAYIFDGLIRNVQFQPNFNDIIRRVTQNYRNWFGCTAQHTHTARWHARWWGSVSQNICMQSQWMNGVTYKQCSFGSSSKSFLQKKNNMRQWSKRQREKSWRSSMTRIVAFTHFVFHANYTYRPRSTAANALHWYFVVGLCASAHLTVGTCGVRRARLSTAARCTYSCCRVRIRPGHMHHESWITRRWQWNVFQRCPRPRTHMGQCVFTVRFMYINK